ncbi:KaiC/GvpD/RAD55 family RecA-like ATPase/5S rRNA maturation endonuclease (ribonuclease M5) [Actinoplanes campanulatus]|uniref:KaiC/GvpD/RAD55 family RecA-like ATPase/5S rRNA maturation endonuclease (Ribonuclease M5) n=1 Tax=Actinoplanes campanulatus TaxID=113559 RepID=A0A7W5ANC9_9ACTN|nr:ATP-binding protein [Actinoplanes campanulatus]MBB3099330.1 KaiC/GvpD/RAD55 family RecA-like ATPase/5S rRNA maturation endonuclease (ribonuclease M5) [Actinoplanes campanulatus]GGN40447.1 hypothetical protein GCM10010109_69550 [Actinoplanes campanulatus]GID40648.1 hypothetical protein Aca09nite_71540 [Actinoplanes campanulatus]
MNETAYDRVVRKLREHGRKVIEKSGGRADATCPAHDDHSPSLSVTAINGRTLVWCHNPECDTRDVLAELELTMADLYDERSATYRYDDGRTVRRYYDERGKKRFTQTGATATSTLYHREALAAVQPGRTVFLVEGEADVDAIESAGGVATTGPQGADSFHKVDIEPLRGHWVTVIVDRDGAGDKWAAQVAEKIDGIAAKYRFMRAAAGKDASDHIAAGYGLTDFEPYAPPLPEKPRPFAFLKGGSFVLDVPDVAPAVWGDGKEVIWAQGEALMLCGPSGVGKTTIAVQLLRARVGLQTKVLGYSVAETSTRVLYLVMDRPAQFRRAAARAFTEEERKLLDDRMVVWKGPPPQDVAARPALLIEMCEAAGADTLFIDSIKDAAVGIAKDEVGAGYNRARQNALSEGVEVIELHHMRKGSSDNKTPNTLDDIYGSTWLTAGAGSVALLWGEAGDPIVKWRHLKQPEVEVGPFDVVHDHERGVSEVEQRIDLIAAVSRSGIRGLTALEYAVLLFEVAKPTAAQKKRAQRALDRKVTEGVLSCIEGSPGGDPSRYYLRQAAAA